MEAAGHESLNHHWSFEKELPKLKPLDLLRCRMVLILFSSAEILCSGLTLVLFPAAYMRQRLIQRDPAYRMLGTIHCK